MYDALRKLLFRLDAESAHHLACGFLGAAERFAPLRKSLQDRFAVHAPDLAVDVAGIRFPNPLGLAAGFDKDGDYPRALAALGFGFLELGTVTAHPQPGNPPPRLFRLPEDEALLNRMGFNNHGAQALADGLSGKRSGIPIGINLGKSKITPNEEALGDYLTSVAAVYRFADYLVVNVSSPNTPGLRDLQEREPLQRLLNGVQEQLSGYSGKKKPLFLKIAPDLTQPQLEDILSLLQETPVEGLIATNTTISREGLQTDARTVEALGAGGISGKPVRKRSTEVIRFLAKGTGGRVPIIGVGGIFTADDALEKLEAGASLVQIYTGFIYGGPDTASRIVKGLQGRWDGRR